MHSIEGSIDVAGRRGKRRKQLVDYLKKKRGYLKEDALDRIFCRTRLGRGNRSDNGMNE
jgi:hypothetical protein